MDADVVEDKVIGSGLAIQQASALLGVPAPTLRSWERRYGLPTTMRSRGGHRRYSEPELQQLRLMRDEVAHGRRAADAALRVRLLLSGDDPAARWVTELLTVSRELRAPAIHEVLDRAEVQLGPAATVDEVLMPALRQVGNWWAAGKCDVGEEHLTTEAVRQWLARKAVLGTGNPGPGVVLACGPRDQHTVGLEALAALLAPHGLQTYLTGARTPPDAVVSCVTRTASAGVVVVSHLPSHRRSTLDALKQLTSTRRPLFYAGNAFLFAGARKGVPGTYLGEGIAAAADVIVRSVTA
ncbi:MAG: MerR family transcriptional regulator, light-induced transcriptional regulator [Nocardioidaceae bacterium]|nr:MerR family transcriptional regulator, light-induced transcriptional regulator [Nocardioidaceae bacterium]